MSNDSSQEPLTKGYIRKLMVGFAAAFGIVILAVVVIVQTGNIDRARGQCERGNVRNVSELHQRTHLVKANKRRIAIGKQEGDRTSVKQNRAPLRKYAKDRREFIDAYADVAYPSAERTVNAPVEQDCEALNQYPPPVSWFD